ncbi:MAG: hypothetical protein IIW01_06010, partial [Thermoguttaceae bacterium]|nr:hypothetical protein [Thermoguttaceae bacterium]
LLGTSKESGKGRKRRKRPARAASVDDYTARETRLQAFADETSSILRKTVAKRKTRREKKRLPS